METKEITAAIAKVMGSVGYVQKKGENKFHGYKFAAIGDLLAKIQPAMVEAGLVITQSELAHELIAEGSVMTATYEFSLSHTSGAVWTDRPRHTGMAGARNSKGGFDDKALNKCHTAARKYFLLGLFQIPTGDVVDPDEEEDKAPAKNGNGHVDPLPPLQRPKQEDHKAAAMKWVQTSEELIGRLSKIHDVRVWEDKNKDAIAKLKALDLDLYDRLMEAVQARHVTLSPLNA